VDEQVAKTVKDQQNKELLTYKMDKQSQQKCNNDDTPTDCDSSMTPALAQGTDYSGANGSVSSSYGLGQTSSKNAKPCPYDINEYVRKDSIPCWGCSLK
jgi:hypothetical protein